MKPPPSRLSVLITLALGLGLTAIGAVTGWAIVTLLVAGEPRLATVTETSRAATGQGSSNLAARGIRFAFEEDGAPVERWTVLASGEYGYDVGDRVEVLVLPGMDTVHPADDLEALAFPFVFLAAGLGVLAMGAAAGRRRLC